MRHMCVCVADLIFLAIDAAVATKLDGVVCAPFIAIPNVSAAFEMDCIAAAIQGGIIAACENSNHTPAYAGIGVGAVIGSPRACFLADSIAACSELRFVTFDTDSLTELVFGMSQADRQSIMVS